MVKQTRKRKRKIEHEVSAGQTISHSFGDGLLAWPMYAVYGFVDEV